MSTKPNRCRSGRVLTVLIAVTLWATACASDAADGAADATPPDTAQADAAPSAGDTEPGDESPDAGAAPADTAAPGSDAEDATSTEAEQERQRVDEERKRREEEERARRQREADAAQTAALRPFGECGAVLDYIQANAAATIGPWGLGDAFGGELAEEGAIAVDDSASGDFGSLQAGVDYSTSNVQEAGIDEPDVLKTDGRRIVVTTQNRVRVVDVTGSEPTLVATLELGEEWGWRLLLHGDRVLAFTSRWDVIVPFAEPADDERPRDVIEPPPGWGPTTEIVEIDLAGSSPAIVSRLSVEGNYVSARMTDGVVRLVTSSRPRAIGWAFPQTADLAASERATEENREIIADTTIEQWLPRYVLSDAAGTAVAGGRLVDCDRVWAPAHYSGPGTLSVTTLDIARDGLAGSMDTTSIMSDGSTVYASFEHLYVTTTEWLDWRVRPARPGDGTLAETEIHMFDVSDPASSSYVGSASVTGTVLNQYSMSEHEGHLRIATTTVPPWRFEGEPDSESFVTVFAADDGGLSEVGQVGGLGIGERIFAVRYLGDVAAVVTFRQVDPLYLLDLSDPAVPTVRGELKISGYSAYLHPLGSDLLLGVGQDANEEGWTLGTQVSLFDIADLDDPRRIDQWTAPGGRSQVEFDALSFLYWPAEHLAVLPMVQHPRDDNDPEPPFLGAVALGTHDRTLVERARITHAARPVRKCRESREIVIRPDGSEQVGPFERYCWYDTDYEARVMASAVVGDRLYLASHKGLESIALGSLARVALLSWGN